MEFKSLVPRYENERLIGWTCSRCEWTCERDVSLSDIDALAVAEHHAQGVCLVLGPHYRGTYSWIRTLTMTSPWMPLSSC